MSTVSDMRNSPRAWFGRFQPVALVLLVGVTAGFVLLDPRDWPTGCATGLAAALLGGGTAEWLAHLGRKHPGFRFVFPAVAITAFIVTAAARIVPEVLHKPWYTATAVLELRLVETNEEMRRGQLQMAYRLLQSDRLLEEVVHRQNLVQEFNKGLLKQPLKTPKCVLLLRRMIGVSVVETNSNLRIEAITDDPRTASAYADTLATVFRHHVEDQHSLGRAKAIAGARVVQQAAATTAEGHGLLWYVLEVWHAFLYAAVAVAGAACAASLTAKPKRLRALLESVAFLLMCTGGALWLATVVEATPGSLQYAALSLFRWMVTFLLGAAACAAGFWISTARIKGLGSTRLRSTGGSFRT